MRKIIYALALSAVSSMSIIACAQDKASKRQNGMTENKKVLVAYFSRTGENYGVGNITKGNTQIVAEMISGETGSDLFHIEPAVAYPDKYDDCVNLAKQELGSKARPAVKGNVQTEDYDVIFIGYPNWWGDMPMPVYTFLEKHDWNGKTIVPFCTHEGSGLGSTTSKLQSACKGAKVLKGLAIYGHTAQNDREETEKATHGWLESLSY
ncbi:MAG: flavodoxin [Bacteroidia bacterium]|nr:flavodoxin [Bacteroidia bacterium]